MFWQISHINVLYCNDYKAYSNISMVIFLCHVFISYILYDEDNSVAILQLNKKNHFYFCKDRLNMWSLIFPPDVTAIITTDKINAKLSWRPIYILIEETISNNSNAN